MIADAIEPPRRAYGNDREQDARLFYTAMTRAERYLYVTHAEQLPEGKRRQKESPFSARLSDGAVVRKAPDALPPNDLPPAPPRRRMDEAVLPTTFSEIRYYLRCPRDYRYRHVWGFSPPIPEMFGFGQTVHAAVGRLHERYAERAPAADEAEAIARELFHVKHVPPSRDPEERPGAYEQGRDAAARIVRDYAEGYASDFGRRRQLEVPFEIPLRDSVLGGSIDLLLHLDSGGAILDASVIDFKTMEGGPGPADNDKLDWTELALQVQLYARAAADVLDANARTGAVHLLRDGQRVEVPVGEDAVVAAVRNVEWAAERIVAGDFPMRPHTMKCGECDWRPICPRVREEFGTDGTPPPLHLPEGRRTVRGVQPGAGLTRWATPLRRSPDLGEPCGERGSRALSCRTDPMGAPDAGPPDAGTAQPPDGGWPTCSAGGCAPVPPAGRRTSPCPTVTGCSSQRRCRQGGASLLPLRDQYGDGDRRLGAPPDARLTRQVRPSCGGRDGLDPGRGGPAVPRLPRHRGQMGAPLTRRGPGRPARPLLAAAPLVAPHGAARRRGRAPPAPRPRPGAAPHRPGPGMAPRPPAPSYAGPVSTAATGGAG